jgi:hypothetical protein
MRAESAGALDKTLQECCWSGEIISSVSHKTEVLQISASSDVIKSWAKLLQCNSYFLIIFSILL